MNPLWRSIVLLSALATDAAWAARAQIRPVVYELFTSEGCSSCPPAELIVNELACEIADAKALYDPSVNLACGVKILTKLVTRDHRIAGQVGAAWKGGAVYWSTLRSSGGENGANARNLGKVVRDTQALSVCRVHN